MEVWAQIGGSYYVSSLGNRMSALSRSKRYIPTTTRSLVDINYDEFWNTPIHKLVAMAFLHNPENKTEVSHIDGNKENNTLSNLRWEKESDMMASFVNDFEFVEGGYTPSSVIKEWCKSKGFYLSYHTSFYYDKLERDVKEYATMKRFVVEYKEIDEMSVDWFGIKMK